MKAYCNRHIWQITYPILISLLMENMIGLTDTAFLGRVGEVELGASALAGVYYMAIFMLGFGFSIGVQILIARRNGEGRLREIGPIFQQGLLFLLFFAAVMFFVSKSFTPLLLRRLIDSDAVYTAAISYLDWRIYGFFFSFAAVLFRAFYVGTTNTRILTANSVVMVLTNVVLNYILIFGKLGLPALGITGAAIATFSSRVVEFVISLVYALRCKQMPLMPACILRPGKATFRSFVKFSTPVLLNETLWGTGTSLYTVIMGHMAGSTDLISAYTVAGNIDKMVTVAIFGVAAAAAVIVGKEVGMGGKNAYPIGQALTFVAFCTGFGVAIAEQLLFWLVLKPHVLPLFSMTAASASLCVTMMICYSISAPLHAFATTGIVGVLRGGGDVRIAMLIDVLPLWCFTLPLLVLLGLVLHAPIAIFCFIMATESALKVPFGLHRIRSGKWIHDVTQDLNA